MKVKENVEEMMIYSNLGKLLLITFLLLCLKTFNAAYHGKQSNGKNWVAGNLCSS
jgi:hypothetical protein